MPKVSNSIREIGILCFLGNLREIPGLPENAGAGDSNSQAFMKKEVDEGEYKVSVTFAPDYLKRNTYSVKCAMENDVFGSLLDGSLLDDLEVAADEEIFLFD